MAEGNEEFTFFWRDNSPFSQWHKSIFTLDDKTFICAEQYMMYAKAVLFNDMEIAEKILQTKDPRRQKQLGRQVKNFDRDKWNEKCKEIVKKGNTAKFSQNEKMKEKLLATKGTVLVEASPYDRIWGIGLDENDPRAKDKTKWQGTNWLGYILTEVRNDLLQSSND
ncbi:riboflavin biosynthesis protein PYRR, chloroplastic-like [Dendronephthya gigantea]|uniref:riboflavin biosynthesis protein PYRR, chloroplastic-like n=1 Tax=Dendronephthya gigantea TaxID=151771 RepID=UPI001069B07E|nr:riboflavin biosynthesis protein PYRR, chloroplastic-like [Dendronephthya gigantea]